MKKLLTSIITLIIVIILNTNQLFSQEKVNDKRLGTWNTLNIQYSFAPKWGIMAEFQARLNKPFHKIFYYEQKGGVYYNINKNFQALLGIGHYATHDENHFSDGPTIREARLWQQFTINQYLSRLKFEHRFRVEERWQNREFNNRFRYRIQLAIPVNNEKIESNTFFFSLFNEIFATTKMPHFMRNRAYAGIGYQLNEIIGFQTGIIHQYNYNLEKAGAKKFLFLNVNIKLEDKSDFPSQIPMID